MTNDHIKTDIPAYLHGDLPESRQRQVESHIASCDGCRHALNKARAKSARSKRQALKNASADPRPNLLMNRLGRQTDVSRPTSGRPWGWLVVLIFLVGGAALLKLRAMRRAAFSAGSSETDVAVSTTVPAGTQTAPPFDVAKSSPSTAVAVQVSSTAPPAPPVVKAPPAIPEPPQTWSGVDSSVKDFREIVINGRRSWRSLWAEMGHDSSAPAVNFVDMMLVGVFAGEQPGADAQVVLGKPKNAGEEFQIPYRILTTVVPSSGTVTSTVAHPYALTTIPRVSKTVRLVRENN